MAKRKNNPNKGYCKWCGRFLHLLQEDVCGFCVEEPEYIRFTANQARIERLSHTVRTTDKEDQ